MPPVDDPTPEGDRGLLAVSVRNGQGSFPDLRSFLPAALSGRLEEFSAGSTRVFAWGIESREFADGRLFELARFTRRGNGSMSLEDVRAAFSGPAPPDLSDFLPPFAAAFLHASGRFAAGTDALGFRHLYHHAGPDIAILSTSARLIGRLIGTGLDRQAVAVQSLLGWQLAARTFAEGVRKLAAGESIAIADGGAEIARRPKRPVPATRPGLSEAVTEAADFLRSYLSSYVADNPDCTLQLTGGQDSRLLLSAIEPSRRKGLTAVTLLVPGSEDVAIAAALAERCGLKHEVVTMDGLDRLSDASAFRLCMASARRLECMGDPIALATLTFVENRMHQGPRLSGLGGEVGRGFYYMGPPLRMPTTMAAVRLLANWRMFANEAVDPAALSPDFAGFARDFTTREIFRLMREGAGNWWEATDAFYLEQRMQRWAGIVDTAVCFEREVVNPMLDRRFLDIACSLAPGHKRNSLFLSRIQVALDKDLAAIPLDGRPPPEAFAGNSLRSRLFTGSSAARKLYRKTRQRFARARKAPAGGIVLTAKVAEHLRGRPELLQPVAASGIFDGRWIDGFVARKVEPSSATMAMLLNLMAFQDEIAKG